MFEYKFKNLNKKLVLDLEQTLNNLNAVEIEQVSRVLKAVLLSVDNMIKKE